MKVAKLFLVAALLATPLAGRAQEPQKVTIDTSGWFVLNTFANRGDFDSRELPRFAFNDSLAAAPDQRLYGMAVRQSRLRMAIGIPTDGLLGGAVLKGFVEGDFMGATGGDISSVIPRLRHAYVTANWKQYSNLTVFVGQTWGVAPGPYFASSLSHLAMPRFGGAGFLFRRAPQVKATFDAAAGPVAMLFQGAVLTPGDFGSQASASKGNDSAFPNLEARIAGAYRPGGKQMAEVGLWTHYGREKYEFAALARDVATTSEAYGVDVKFDFPYVSLLGGAFQGANLDVLASIAGSAAAATGSVTGGVVLDNTNGLVQNMETEGLWAQAIVTPVKGFQVVAGYAVENPDDSTLALPGATIGPNIILKNTQYSAAAILNLTSKWRISLEATRYLTFTAQPTRNDTFTSTQFEMSTLLAL